MKKTDVKIDGIVSAKSEEELTEPFIGKIEKIYENSALLKIIAFAPADETAVGDLNKKIVVNFKNLKAASKQKLKKIQDLVQSDVKVEKIAPTAKAEEKAAKDGHKNV